MAEVRLLFRQMMRTLREARQAVQAELDQHAAASSDPDLLVHLQRSAEELGDQATSLVALMRGRNAEAALAQEAEDLAHYFQDTERHILSLLEAGRGVQLRNGGA